MRRLRPFRLVVLLLLLSLQLQAFAGVGALGCRMTAAIGSAQAGPPSHRSHDGADHRGADHRDAHRVAHHEAHGHAHEDAHPADHAVAPAEGGDASDGCTACTIGLLGFQVPSASPLPAALPARPVWEAAGPARATGVLPAAPERPPRIRALA